MTLLLFKEQGQGVVETLLALPLFLLTIGTLALLLHRGAVYFLADYHLHEALICAQSRAGSLCERELRQRLLVILPPRQQKIQTHLLGTRASLHIPLTPPLSLFKELRGVTR
ncbi:MAG: hypothetical protein AAGB31_06015 [Bdellovibrio sp.]